VPILLVSSARHDAVVTEFGDRESVHVRRPWVVSLVVAVMVTLPALLIALWHGSGAATPFLVLMFLVWFVGGGIRRRRRLRDRTN
jgi:hypothetical protein